MTVFIAYLAGIASAWIYYNQPKVKQVIDIIKTPTEKPEASELKDPTSVDKE